jgi:hypothetical protein
MGDVLPSWYLPSILRFVLPDDPALIIEVDRRQYPRVARVSVLNISRIRLGELAEEIHHAKLQVSAGGGIHGWISATVENPAAWASFTTILIAYMRRHRYKRVIYRRGGKEVSQADGMSAREIERLQERLAEEDRREEPKSGDDNSESP